jgi:hypothetical protein
VDACPLDDEVVGKDHARQRRCDVAEMDDPALGMVDEAREARETHGSYRYEDARAEAAESRHRVHERETGRIHVRDVGGEGLNDDREEHDREQDVSVRQTGDSDERVPLPRGRGGVAADERRDRGTR